MYYKRKNIYRNYPQETVTVKWINDETVEISDHTLNVKQTLNKIHLMLMIGVTKYYF
ncbi:DUF5412 domain-containing protein [Priestia megaterium]|nr:DUF5412 domain-containing protein [Priestia megaterium]MCU7739572.1 DUF5412 domain-containing protein [Priestia megaterium]MCU7744954.1 DUF5412 domain-containing protein [Priestia megaterium]